MAIYSPNSPYYLTKNYGNFLDVLTIREIPAHSSDTYYEIDHVYNFRPDLLAGDLYDDSGLWWVFAVRNANTIKDPIFDFATGAKIYIPLKTTLISLLKVA